MPYLFALVKWFCGRAAETVKVPTLRWGLAMVGFFSVLATCQLDAAVPAINAGGTTELTCP